MGEKLSKSEADNNSNTACKLENRCEIGVRLHTHSNSFVFWQTVRDNNNSSSNNNHRHDNQPEIIRAYAQSRVFLSTIADNITKQYTCWLQNSANSKTLGKLAELPHDLFAAVVRMMTPHDLLRLGQVNKALYCITAENSLWKHFIEAKDKVKVC